MVGRQVAQVDILCIFIHPVRGLIDIQKGKKITGEVLKIHVGIPGGSIAVVDYRDTETKILAETYLSRHNQCSSQLGP